MNVISYLKEKRLPFIHDNNFIAEQVLVPHANKNNSNRSVMFCSHFQQAPILANIDKDTGEFNGETPLVNSRFENQVGEYSSGYKELPYDCKVLFKFVRNKYNYFLVVYKYDTKTYDVIERKECEWITEKYGYRNINYMDEIEIGDKLEKDTILSANTSYDEQMNLCYGRNMKALYYSFEDHTHEDAIVISESAAKKFDYNAVEYPRININTNDILLKIYGENKCFPDIGEYVNDDQILLIRRRNNYDTMLTNLKDLKHYKDGDTPYFCRGKVVDINVYCNNDVEKLRGIPYYKQIVKYIDMQDNYYKKVIECLEDIVEKETDRCSERLVAIYNDCKMRLDEGNYFEFENNRFDNIVIEFTIIEEKHLEKGCKLTGRCGNKGIVSKIVPDDEMPYVSEGPLKGTRADICLNPLGKNYAQLKSF